MDLETFSEVADHFVTSAAVLVGGIWAYLKFVRGRTFAHRAELSVSLTLARSVGSHYLCAAVSLKNTGLSKLKLNQDMKAIRLFGVRDPNVDHIDTEEWERVCTRRILDQHEWLESQETVEDTILYFLPLNAAPGAHYIAYQVEALVGSVPSLVARRRTRWRSRAIIVPSPEDLLIQRAGKDSAAEDAKELGSQ